MALCDDLGGWDRGVVRRRLERGRIHTHTHTHTHTYSCFTLCMAETNTTLYSNYTLVKKNKRKCL